MPTTTRTLRRNEADREKVVGWLDRKCSVLANKCKRKLSSPPHQGHVLADNRQPKLSLTNTFCSSVLLPGVLTHYFPDM